MLSLYFAAPGSPPPPPGGPVPPPNAGKPPVPPAGNMPEDEDDDEDSIASEVSNVLAEIMPWTVSILLHAGVVLLAVFIVWATLKDPPKEEPLVPLANLTKDPGGLKVTEKTKMTQSKSAKRTISKQKTQSQSEATKPKDVPDLVGATGGAQSSSNPFGGEVGDSSPFSGAKFFGNPGGNAKRLVYMVDASGSLIDTLPFVINELERSISELSPQQSFTVFFFQDSDQGFIEVPGADRREGLREATPENKQKAADWMAPDAFNVVPHGPAHPRKTLIEALRRAVRYRPQLIFLLSDNITGREQYELSQEELVEGVKNVLRHVNDQMKINTIQFIYPDPLVQAGKKPTLELIAKLPGERYERFHGNYKYVSREDLGLAE